MKKDVWISITNRQYAEQDGDNTMVFDTAGSWLFADGVGVLTYQESELTGMEGTWTSVRITPERVEVDRDGLVSSRMVFQKGVRDFFPYDTPYGEVLLGIDTHSIRHSVDESGGDVEISYTTDLASTFYINNRFRISVKEMEKTNG